MYKKFSGVVLMALAVGCYSGVEGEELGPDLQELDEVETIEIMDNLVQAGYPEQEIEVQEDGSIVLGGDAVVTLGASREMAGIRRVASELEDDDDFRQYRTNNLVNAPQTISVYGYTGNNSNGLDATMQSALTQAVANYNSLGIELTFTLAFGTNYNPHDIVVYNVAGGGGGSAGFPENGAPYKWVQIQAGTSGFGTDVVEHVITHEIGHCLGFRHTDYFDRSLSCGSGGNEGSAGVGANHIPGTPAGTDNNSIMQACFSAGEDGEFGNYDVVALQELYGGGVGGGPNSCVGACDANAGNCWCDDQCAGFGDCCADKVAVCG